MRGYVGALDYVWYEPRRMTMKRQIPLPSREDVAEYLPSAKFPSDHLSASLLSVLCTLLGNAGLAAHAACCDWLSDVMATIETARSSRTRQVARSGAAFKQACGLCVLPGGF